MDKTPDFIYKYYPPTDLALRAFQEQRIYFGLPTNFNDPYDCAYVPRVKSMSADKRKRLFNWVLKQPGAVVIPPSESDMIPGEQEAIKMANHALNVVRNANLQENKIACFSERGDNVLMWSLYGVRNKGFCLQFCTKEAEKRLGIKKMIKVQYKKEPPHFDVVELLEATASEQEEKMMALLRTKSCDWAYEREWRLMAAQGVDKVEYPPHMLKAVFLGVYIDSKTADTIRSTLRDKNPDTELWQGYFDEDEYKVSFKRCD